MTVVLTAEANSTFDCVDGAGRAVPPRVPLIAQVSDVQRFHAGADGRVNGSLTVTPPSTVQVPCAGSLRPRLATISYESLRLSDVTNQLEVVLAASV